VDNKGTALIVTMVYLIIVALICVAALSFSSAHYKLMSQRVDKFQNAYLAEGGLYLGVYQGTNVNPVQLISTDPNSTVSITGNLTSKRTYSGM